MNEGMGGAATANRDLVVSPGDYAYMQDTTKGQVKTHTGPTVVNQAGQDKPVIFIDGRFKAVQALEDAVRQSPQAKEGDYLILSNPSVEEGHAHPETGVGNLPDLDHGRKVNIPGPATFALWPGQEAQVIPGHHLRSNQFLLVRVYNEEEAKTNWDAAVVKAVAPSGEGKKDEKAAVTAKADKLDLSMGRRYIIKGTEVSFYIPPTGVEVLQDEKGQYVREAVTLEQLEIAILVDEDGNKRYEKGPQVVFPEPTEEFQTDSEGKRKFKAVEMNNIQGIHVKVISPFIENEGEDDEVVRKEGDEYFITGRDCAIFYPRPELQIIQYDGRLKHYAVAVPEGEGRYVMDREEGEIATEKGPQMLLPNPVTHVIVRRPLTENQSRLWYPGNQESANFNRELRAMTAKSPADAGALTEAVYASTMERFGGEDPDFRRRSLVSDEAIPGGVSRETKFTKPREVTLDTKYDGVPVVCPWTGYAVMVVSRSGKREVKQGPATILMGYAEELEVLTLSTGKPKNFDNPYQTVYLRVKNNKVGDIVSVHTSDHVLVDIKLSFRVDFEGKPEKWFEVENYVKLLSDHVRSMLKGTVRKIDIETFYGDGVAVVRDIVLGKSVQVGEPKDDEAAQMERPGLFFEENGMRVVDVEVLDITIMDERVSEMLEEAQFAAVSGNVRLAQAEKALKITTREEEISRETSAAEAKTVEANLKLDAGRVSQERAVDAAKQKADLDAAETEKDVQEATEAVRDLASTSDLERRKAEGVFRLETAEADQALRMEEAEKEAKLVVERLGAMNGGMTEALMVLSNRETMTKIAEALSVQRLIGGENIVEVLGKVFTGTPLEGVMDKVMSDAGGDEVMRRVAGNGARSAAGVEG